MENNLTALMCLFIKAYHTKDKNYHIINDKLSTMLLKENEYDNISKYLKEGIDFFDPLYSGTNKIKHIINKYIGPSVFAREAFVDEVLKHEGRLGLKQYVVLGSGYDTSGYKFKDIRVYELDQENVIDDKLNRLKNINICNNINYIKSNLNDLWVDRLLKSGYDKNLKSLYSLLGLSYYLTKDKFFNVLFEVSKIIPVGSAIVFDYPNESKSDIDYKNEKLAFEANCEMKSKYSYEDILRIASKCNMQIYNHKTSDDINKLYFYDYNTINIDEPIKASDGVSYCLLVKR